ncbi:MAG: hypothetical protein V5A57_02140 [Candidatus Paceibacterota bacterium]
MSKHITNKSKFKETVKGFQENKGEYHILSDFDRTLTYGTDEDGSKRPSLISVLRNGDYLDEDYAERAHGLFDKFHPIEEDPEVSTKRKKEAMQEWWSTHNQLLIEKGLSKQDLKDITEEGGVRFRKGVPEFLQFLHENNIPLVIISAGGAGEAIPMFFEEKDLNYPNIHFVVNRFEWNEEGKATNHKGPIIHSLNKDETVLEEYPEIYDKIKKRRKVILFGDKVEDIDMIKGFDYNRLLTVGFLCYRIEERKEGFKKKFDLVLEGDDEDFTFINEKLISP